MTCESNDGRRKYCGSANPNRVSMQRQLSSAACVQGQTWGVDNQGLWVDRGCRGVFDVGRFNGGGGNGPGYGGGSISNYPRVQIDTSGRGNFTSRNWGSANVTRGWVDTRSGRASVSLTGSNNFKVTFYGDVTDGGDRRIVLRITSSNRGRADGRAEILLNGDKNEVQSISVNGNNFNGNFSR